MKCPLNCGERIKRCAAVQGIVVMSLYEIRRYCESGKFKRCPVYRENKKHSGGIPFNLYLSIMVKETESDGEERQYAHRVAEAC